MSSSTVKKSKKQAATELTLLDPTPTPAAQTIDEAHPKGYFHGNARGNSSYDSDYSFLIIGANKTTRRLLDQWEIETVRWTLDKNKTFPNCDRLTDEQLSRSIVIFNAEEACNEQQLEDIWRSVLPSSAKIFLHSADAEELKTVRDMNKGGDKNGCKWLLSNIYQNISDDDSDNDFPKDESVHTLLCESSEASNGTAGDSEQRQSESDDWSPPTGNDLNLFGNAAVQNDDYSAIPTNQRTWDILTKLGKGIGAECVAYSAHPQDSKFGLESVAPSDLNREVVLFIDLNRDVESNNPTDFEKILVKIWQPHLKGKNVRTFPLSQELVNEIEQREGNELGAGAAHLRYQVALAEIGESNDAEDRYLDGGEEIEPGDRRLEFAQESDEGLFHWETPLSIRAQLEPVAPFDFKMVHPRLRPYIDNNAKRIGCRPDFVFQELYIKIGSLIGRKAVVKPKSKDDWHVYPNLWGMKVGKSGSQKSPSVKAVQRRVEEIEADFETAFLREDEIYQKKLTQHKMIESAVKEEVKKAVKKIMKDTEANGPEEISKTLDKFPLPTPPEEPSQRRLKAQYATVEALSKLCKENPNGLHISFDELSGLFGSWEREGHQQDKEFFLESYDGWLKSSSDTIGRGHVESRPLLSLSGCLVPHKLAGLLRAAAKYSDGMIQRFQASVFPDFPTHKPEDISPDTSAEAIVSKLFRLIVEGEFSKSGKSFGEHHEIKSTQFSFSNKLDDGRVATAQNLFDDWASECLDQCRAESESDSLLAEHYSKSPAVLAKLSLIDHVVSILLDDSTGPIKYESTDRAVMAMAYLHSHARRIYGMLRHTSPLVQYIAEKLLDGHSEFKEGFTLRNVKRSCRELSGVGPDNDREILKALDELETTHWIRGTKTEGFQKGNTTKFLINPMILAIRKRPDDERYQRKQDLIG